MDALTFHRPSSERGWQRIDEGAIFGPESETITPVTGAGARSTVFEARRAHRVTIFIEYTGDQAVVLDWLTDYAMAGANLAIGFETDSGSINLPAGNVTPVRMYAVISNAAPFMQARAVAALALSTGDLKLTLYASSHAA